MTQQINTIIVSDNRADDRIDLLQNEDQWANLWSYHGDNGAFSITLPTGYDGYTAAEYSPVDVLYVNRDAVDVLLGDQGKHVLKRVITLIRDTAHEEKWPLEKIEIRHIRDFEVKDWEYIVVVLVFNCTFETASAYLEDIYQRLDALVEKLSVQERELIANLIYLDIATNEDVPSS